MKSSSSGRVCKIRPKPVGFSGSGKPDPPLVLIKKCLHCYTSVMFGIFIDNFQLTSCDTYSGFFQKYDVSYQILFLLCISLIDLLSNFPCV